MATLRGEEIIAHCLKREGVDTIFFMMGGPTGGTAGAWSRAPASSLNDRRSVTVKPPAGFDSPLAMREGYARPAEVSIARRAIFGALFARVGASVVVRLALGDAVEPFSRDVVEGLDVLLVVLAADEPLLDVALDRALVEEADVLDIALGVGVSAHGGFS